MDENERNDAAGSTGPTSTPSTKEPPLVFTGRWPGTLDDKGRLVVPAKVRDAVVRSRQGLHFFLGPGPGKTLVLYDQENFKKLLARLADKLRDDPRRQSFERRFYSRLEMVECDKAGRILVSEELRVHAGIERDVLVVGANERVEIWNPSAWNQLLAATDDGGFEDVARSWF